MKQLLSLSTLLVCSLMALSQSSEFVATNPNDSTVYTIVDAIATFPGGKTAWINFIQKNLKGDVGAENGAKSGTYKVVIKFTVTKEGVLKDFRPVTKYGYGLEQEVIRVLKLSPNWKPAKKNGLIVNSFVNQSQAFVVANG